MTVKTEKQPKIGKSARYKTKVDMNNNTYRR